MIKQFLQDLTGYYIHKNSELEIGASLKIDINRFLDSDVRIVLDIGANIGQSALVYAREFKDATIFSFEPF
jgi:predicted O-methyltransferase YrrM